jgi:hypothetical protein
LNFPAGGLAPQTRRHLRLRFASRRKQHPTGSENLELGVSIPRVGDGGPVLEIGRLAGVIPALPFFLRFLVKWKAENIEWRISKPWQRVVQQ